MNKEQFWLSNRMEMKPTLKNRERVVLRLYKRFTFLKSSASPRAQTWSSQVGGGEGSYHPRC